MLPEILAFYLSYKEFNKTDKIQNPDPFDCKREEIINALLDDLLEGK